MAQTKRTRILHLITQMPFGGAQDYMLLCVAGLDRSLYEIHIATAPDGNWLPRAREVADQVHYLPNMRRNLSPLNDLLTVRDIAQLLKSEPFDIVQTHSSKAGFLGRLAAKLAGVPIIIHTFHGFAFNDETFPKPIRQTYLTAERLSAHLCDHLVMVSRLNLEEAVQRGVAPRSKMSVIYNGIDLQQYADLPSKADARARLHLPADAQVVGTVGRLSACNAPMAFLTSAEILIHTHPKLHALVVGDGEMRAEVEARIGDQSRIHFLGYRDDVPAILAALDVFMFPNLWGGLGRSVTEALAAGVPVVAFPVNGTPELVEDRQTGLHAIVGDPVDMAAKTAEMLARPQYAEWLARHGRDRVHQLFCKEVMVAAHEQLYAELLSAKGIAPTGSMATD